MIPIQPQPEPDAFDKRVRQPGKRFLSQWSRPTRDQWRTHAYWRRVNTELYNAFNEICAYSCHWIPPDTGFNTCEHFRPKERCPNLAYEWDNYRLVCGTLNGRKGHRENVLDPFHIGDHWFVINFRTLEVEPAPSLSVQIKNQVTETIEALKLNDEGTCLQGRWHWLREYCSLRKNGKRPGAIEFLTRHAPFLSRELQRQGLQESICNRMGDGRSE